VSDLVEPRTVEDHDIRELLLEMLELSTVLPWGLREHRVHEARVEPHEEPAREVLALLEERSGACLHHRQQSSRVATTCPLEDRAQRRRRIQNDREPQTAQREKAPLALALGGPYVPEHLLAQRLADLVVEQLDSRCKLHIHLAIADRTLLSLSLPSLLFGHRTPSRRARREEGYGSSNSSRGDSL